MHQTRERGKGLGIYDVIWVAFRDNLTTSRKCSGGFWPIGGYIAVSEMYDLVQGTKPLSQITDMET